MKHAVRVSLVAVAALLCVAPASPGSSDVRLKKASRGAMVNGWVPVHLSGSPAEIGYQHGYLLAPEIEDNYKAIRLTMTHDSKDWNFFRTAAESVLWPHIDAEYQAELQGIVDGLKAKGSRLDIWDITAMNASLELPYYADWYDKQKSPAAKPKPVAERCSAFVATGSYTKDGKIVIGHNNWSDYATAARWNIIFDITPEKGHRILMDGMPGLIHSGDDFGLNSAGIIITETTISGFHGFDPDGVPEFARARKAMQYAASIDDFARIMKDGNNGGYANNWLAADRNTNEIASLELGLKNVNLWRSKDGYFVGANFPVDPKLAAEETTFAVNDPSVSSNARRVRWGELMQQYKGDIDIVTGQLFLADHHDTFDKKRTPNERTLCGHIDKSPRGVKPWQPEYGAAGVAQAKITDATLAGKMSMFAALGHPCGIPFIAADHLQAHPEFAWMKPVLKDIPSEPWALFAVK